MSPLLNIEPSLTLFGMAPLWQSPCVTLILPLGSHGNKAWCRRLASGVSVTYLIEMWYHGLGWIIFVTMSYVPMINHDPCLSCVVVWYTSILAISSRFTSLALRQSYDYPSTSDIKLSDMKKKLNKRCDITKAQEKPCAYLMEYTVWIVRVINATLLDKDIQVFVMWSPHIHAITAITLNWIEATPGLCIYNNESLTCTKTWIWLLYLIVHV